MRLLAVLLAFTAFCCNGGGFSLTPFTHLNVGGGGNITGQSIQPGTGVRFQRGDVFGAYLWNTSTNRWSQIATRYNLPAANFGYYPVNNSGSNQVLQGSSGVMDLQGCYSNSSCAYMFMNGLIFYSANITPSNPSAVTWCNVAGFTQTTDTSNAPDRGPGPFIAIDPANSDHVVVGTPSTGLFETFNGTSCGSASWAAISTSSIPLGTDNVPAYLMAFDPTSGTQTCHTGSGTCTSKMYIFTPGGGGGLYVTSNAGTSWTKTSGGPTTMHNLVVSTATLGAGNVWATVYNGTSYAVWMLVGSTWTTVLSGGGGPVAINPLNGNHVAVTNGGSILASTNGSTAAATFTTYTNALAGGDAPWNAAIWLARNSLSPAGGINFDPNNNDVLIFGGAQAVWTAPFPTSGSTVTVTVMTSGIEGLIFSQIQVGSLGSPSMGAQDEAGCKMSITPNNNATSCFPIANMENLTYASGLSIPPGVSNFMTAKISGNPYFTGQDWSGYSTDGFGTNYLPFNSWNAAPTPSNFSNNGSGVVRVSGISTTGLTSWSAGVGSIICTISTETLLNGFSNRCYGASVVNSTTVDLLGSTWDASLNYSGRTYTIYVPTTSLSDWNGVGTISNITNDGGKIKVNILQNYIFQGQQIVCISGVVMTGASVVNGCWSTIGGGTSFDLGPTSTFAGGDSYVSGGVARTWQAPGGNIAAGSSKNITMVGADKNIPRCTTDFTATGATWSDVVVAGIPLAKTTVTGGPYSAGTTSITVASGSAVGAGQFMTVPLTSGRIMQDYPANVTGNTVTLGNAIPPGDSIANGAAISTDTGWPFAAYLNTRVIVPDGATPNTFFAMNTDIGLVKWTNCGSTTIVANDSGFSTFLQFASFNSNLKPVPGQAGHLFWTAGPQGSSTSSHPGGTQLWRTCNGVNNTANSVTFSAVPGFFEPQVMGFGKIKSGTTYPPIYVIGWYSATNTQSTAVYGVWESTNDANNGSTGTCATGNTWTNLLTQQGGDPQFPQGWLAGALDIEGDPFVYGPVYYSGQFGAYYGVFNYLLKRDLNPASNDNDPMWLEKTG